MPNCECPADPRQWSVSRPISTWADLEQLPQVWLNLGAKVCCHPNPDYLGWVSIDRRPKRREREWRIQHTFPEWMPLCGVADRILTEHFLEHLAPGDVASVLENCHCQLKPGGLLRVAVPDANAPLFRASRAAGRDLVYPRIHRSLWTKDSLQQALVLAGFRYDQIQVRHWWSEDHLSDDEVFHARPIDYSLGFVRRTPDNDTRPELAGDRFKYASLVIDAWA